MHQKEFFSVKSMMLGVLMAAILCGIPFPVALSPL